MKKQFGLAGAVLLALPFMLAGCGEGASEGASPDEDRTRFQPETTREAPASGLNAPDTSEGDGDAPPPPTPGG
jgi:hypothetical protein